MGHYTYKVQKNTATNKWELIETYHPRYGDNSRKQVAIYANRLKRFVNHLGKQLQKQEGVIVHFN